MSHHLTYDTGGRWDERGTIGDPDSVGLICPRCAALVPPGVDRTGMSYQARHVAWHVSTDPQANVLIVQEPL